MKIITISREFGSGGRELGKRLAEQLGFDYYDREIITAIANIKGLNENYVEDVLENHGWQSFPLTYRSSFIASSLIQPPHAALLLEQKKVIEGIAKSGKDCIIVGRNADILLNSEIPFSIFVCADMETRISRCMERAERNEKLSRKAIEQNIRSIDKIRAQSREIIGGSKWGQASSYNVTFNTANWSIKELAPFVAEFVTLWFERRK